MSIPPVDLDAFTGTVVRGRTEACARTAELRGRRVGLIGDPAAMARTLDVVARHARTVTAFQDRPVWVLPRVTGSALPGAELIHRLLPVRWRSSLTRAVADRHLRWRVRDPWTRRQLTPRHPPSRATLVYSDTYLPALCRPNVQLVTWPVTGVVATGLRTADGLERRLDLIIDLRAGSRLDQGQPGGGVRHQDAEQPATSGGAAIPARVRRPEEGPASAAARPSPARRPPWPREAGEARSRTVAR